MNERIREIERQSGIEIYGLGLDRVKWESTLEKFAELIVRECIQVCKKQEYEYWRSPEDQEFTPQDCADAIARHFGVEE